MKHVWWAGVITVWLAITGWAVLEDANRPDLATSVARSGAAIAVGCGALLLCGLFAGKLDD